VQLVTKKISELIPYVNNSRTHNDLQVAQIAASIREFGFTNPVLIDDKNNLIAGHGRLMAARKLEMTEVPCIVLVGLSDTKRKALIIADNQLALNAGWDLDILKLEINALGEEDFDIDLLGFDEKFLASLQTLEPMQGLTDDDGVPKIEKNIHGVALGDVWQLGSHRLICGDCTDVLLVEKLMAGRKANMVWSDPPYNVAYVGKTKDALTIQNDEMNNGDFRAFLNDVYKSFYIALEAGGAIYIAHADSEGENFRGAFRDAGLLLKQTLIWVKNSLVMGRQDYHWKHEPILYGWKEGAAHKWYADRKQTTVLEFDRPTKSEDHPTMKPVELVTYCVNNSSQPNDIVCDFFLGSGTTLIACEKLRRSCYGFEIDPHYCSVIIERFEKFSGKKAVRL